MELPSFSTDALSSLTQKIQSNLKKSVKATGKATTKEGLGSDSKADRDVEVRESTQAGTGKRPEGTTKPTPHPLSVPKANGSEQSKGKKRLHGGEVKEPIIAASGGKPIEKGNRKSKSNEKSSPSSDKKSLPKADTKSNKTTKILKGGPSKAQGGARAGESTSSAQRLSKNSLNRPSSKNSKVSGPSGPRGIDEEIHALDGHDGDLELIDVDSDSELEGGAPTVVNIKLDQELRKFAKGLGIQKAKGQDISTNEDAEYVEESDEEGHVPELPNPNQIALQPRKRVPQLPNGARGREPSHLKFEPRAEWHSAHLPPLSNTVRKNPASAEIIHQLHQYAKDLLDEDNKQYALHNGSSSSAAQFYSTIMTSGTLSDKVSALTLSVQESPVHNVRALESLVGLAKKRSRGQAVEVLGALKDLLAQGSLLPSERRLRVFAAQPGLSAVNPNEYKDYKSGSWLPKPLEKVHLISWAFEDMLKSTYFEILRIIETWCNDEIVFARAKAVEYVYELLRDKPEQEANLLRLLVNKLGDSDKKIASKASYNILQLQVTHPLMKQTIISSIESDLLFRPGQSLHAKYYAVITLNQTVLSGKEEAVAKSVLDIYFSLFLNLLEKPKAVEPVLSETNTTRPMSFNKKGERQGGGGIPGKKAKIKATSQLKDSTVDEELREKMMSAVLTGVNRALPYTKADDEYFDKHTDTLFRVTHSSNFNTSIQALMLIQQLCGTQQAASDRFYRTLYESLLDPRLLTSSKQALYLNLLYRALRADLKVKRVKAFAKRLLQIIAMHQPSFACGVLFLLRELESDFADLKALADQPEEDESDEEDFQDVEDESVDRPARAIAIKSVNRKSLYSYDGRKREPEFANAERSCLWELDPFLAHYHPSVSLFASRLLTHDTMPAKPDLAGHTLIHFLDRFVYRNAKKNAAGTRGSSIMQPLGGGDKSSLLLSANGKHGFRAPVNTEAFWKMDGSKVDADEVFFHKYFNAMGRGKELAKKKKKKADKVLGAEDASQDEEDENEEEIWKALVDSRPEVEGSDDSDDDLNMDDLESALGDDSEKDSSKGGMELDQVEIHSNAEDESDDLGFDDDDALLSSDDEVPSDLDKVFENEVEFANGKASTESETRGGKRRRLKSLPMFASVDDYAAMLDADDVD